MNRNFMEQREYDMLYRTRRDTVTSSEDEYSSEEEIEEKEKFKYSKTTFNFLGKWSYRSTQVGMCYLQQNHVSLRKNVTPHNQLKINILDFANL